MDWINFGVTALKKEALGSVEAGRICDEPTFYGRLIAQNQLRAFEVGERVYEIGSERSLREFADALREGQLSGKRPLA